MRERDSKEIERGESEYKERDTEEKGRERERERRERRELGEVNLETERKTGRKRRWLELEKEGGER
eukprot:1376130-Amorphochlora_amoeboformis.AAC.1